MKRIGYKNKLNRDVSKKSEEDGTSIVVFFHKSSSAIYFIFILIRKYLLLANLIFPSFLFMTGMVFKRINGKNVLKFFVKHFDFN